MGRPVHRRPPGGQASKELELYRNQRFRLKAYQFKLANRKYIVRLHFCEFYWDAADKRVFDVKIQGQIVLTDLDPRKEGGAGWKPVVREFKGVAVTGGSLQLEFITKKNNAEVNGIEIFAE
jgi:hypothetical protein